LAKQADKIVRNAERNMFNGKNEKADELLNEAATLLEKAKAEDPESKRVKQTETKYDRVRKQVDRKLAGAKKKSSSEIRGLANKPEVKPLSSSLSQDSDSAGKQSQESKLPGGVSKRLKDINGHLDNAERYASRDAKKSKYKLQQASALFDESDRMYRDQFDPSHSEYVVVKNRFNDLEGKADAQGAQEARAKADAAKSQEAMEKQSAEWIAKFQEYLSFAGQEGHNPETYVFVPGTSEPEKFSEAQRRYEEFKAFYAEYKESEFPHGKTWLLEDLADNQAPLRLKNFEEGMTSRTASLSGDVEKEIDSAMAQLNKDNGWKSDKKIKPNLVDVNWMSRIRSAYERMITALGAESPQPKAVQIKYDALVAKDKEHREIRKERTFMTPDQFTGDGLSDLKEKAKSLVKNDNKGEGGEPLRCTIISPSWKEKTVEEWTDTTKTTWRIRTTRSVTAQVAAKRADGVRLITVALAQDKTSNGQWGPLYGNLHQYSDPMLEANVYK